MPKQELFFAQEVGTGRIEVLKSYDESYAREAFANMDDAAQKHLWNSLKPEEIYDPGGLPSLSDPNDIDGEAETFLWDELLDQARERDQIFSFFIVNETKGNQSESLYVSPDWPTAERFAKERVTSIERAAQDMPQLRPHKPIGHSGP